MVTCVWHLLWTFKDNMCHLGVSALSISSLMEVIMTQLRQLAN